MWCNTKTGWGWVIIFIHWLTAFTVIGMFVLGLWMTDLTLYDQWYLTAPSIHKSVGISLLLLTMFRLIWRWKNITPEALSTHNQFEKKVASLVSKLIYVLLFLIMLSGYLISTADGREIIVFGLFEVPATLYGIDNQEDVAGVVHLTLAVSLILLIVFHAAAALKHHFFDKDETLKRMLKVENQTLNTNF